MRTTAALYDPHTGSKKRYKRFDAFVRTMIMLELRHARQNPDAEPSFLLKKD